MRRILLHQLAIVLVAGTVMFTHLGATQLWDRDETRNARCTVEMLERGDWIVPYYNGDVRIIKPVGMYWFMMLGTALFGPTEIAFRFWSAVAGIGTVLLTYHIGRRLFHAEVGLWAGLILGTSLMFVILSRAAKVDALLIFFNTLSLAIYVHSVFKPVDDRSRGNAEPAAPQLRYSGQYYPQSLWAIIPMFALMGLAVLGKGPIGVILPTAVIGMYLLVMRLPSDGEQSWHEPALRRDWRSMLMTLGWIGFSLLVFKVSWEFGVVVFGLLAIHLFYRRLPIFRPFAPGHFLATCWSMRPITAILAVGLCALPWHIWVALRDIRWIEGFYLVHNLGRATGAMENHGGSDLAYYPITIALGFAPWSMFLAPMFIEAFKRIRGKDGWWSGYVLIACWVGVYVGLFSLAKTKLPNYVTPCYPALALIAACYLYHLRRATTWAAAWWPRVSMACLITVGAGLAIGLPVAAHIYCPGDEWLGLVGVVPITGAVFSLILFVRNRPQAATWCYAGFAAAFMLALLVGVAERVDRHQRFQELIAVARQNADPEIASFQRLEPSWVFYCNRNIHEFSLAEKQQVREFLSARTNRFVITTNECWPRLQSQLPTDVRILAECPQFLKPHRLLLIGRVPADTSLAGPDGDQPLRR